MPPRKASARGGSQAARGEAPLALGKRSGGAGRGSQPRSIPSASAPSHESDIKGVCVKRPNFGKAGRRVILEVNSFELTTTDNDISHYDDITPDVLSTKRKLVLFQALQDQEVALFTPKLVYDGQKMAYGINKLDLAENDPARQFSVSFERGGPNANPNRPPRVFNITLKKVAVIRTEFLRRLVDGKQSSDNRDVLNALMAYNIAIRTDPNLNNPFRGRSFYIDSDRLSIGAGLEVWRGIFQSVRPAIGRLVINIDLTATIMYKEGPLVRLINEFYGKDANTLPTYLTPGHGQFPSQYNLVQLKRFITGLRVTVSTTGGSRPRKITGLTEQGANNIHFQSHAGTTISVAQYFNQVLGQPLQFPTAICVQIGTNASVPLEACTVLRGQFIGKSVAVPEEQINQVLKFATKKPVERLEAIKKGIDKLQFNQSNYIAQFGLSINRNPLQVESRVINPPTLKYSDKGKQKTQVPRNGQWNMLDKQLYEAAEITVWAIAIFDTNRTRSNDDAIQGIIKDFRDACERVGITLTNPDPVIHRPANVQGNVEQELKLAGRNCLAKYKTPPNLIVVILPDGPLGTDIYTNVKRFGDVTMGIATQCLKAKLCTRARPDYWSNVMLKINPKLGGINTIAESPAIAEYVTDPRNPAIVIGADVMHPPPGSQGRPSFTTVVGSVDRNAAKYIATSCVQTGRQEIISDLKEMCKYVLKYYSLYQQRIYKKVATDSFPKRLLFYRDGVSEGQFKQVLDLELPLIQEACKELGINPKITLIIVGKRHHNQAFPKNNKENKNAEAGTVIDTVIAHPLDFDFILQSHAGILGTSRPAHYSVLYDEFGFNADSIQSLSYALCHVYARSTRSVSIPAPVYYADIVCARAKTRFANDSQLGMSDTGTQASGQSGGGADVEAYKQAYKPLHQNQVGKMYFM